ncbi:adenylosuccinate lyase [Candidatus Curtissbacteria bacterium]|nr:adenylosuccinate lyase [Candidatus Curtissbacteria bacterium]
MSEINFNIYQSPFSWRYGSAQMRELFSEINRRKTWRKVWVALAKSQNKLGLISKEELEDIVKHQDEIDIETAHKIEEELKHDLMAELKTFASQAKVGGGKIHFGATSQDIEDNADTLLMSGALGIIEKDLKSLLKELSKRIEENKDLVCMAYTHLQPAEPTTLGYRFSFYTQDLLTDLELLHFVKAQLKGKGLKGAVGNSASYFALLGEKSESLEKEVLTDLGIEAFDVTTQVYPRKLDFLVLSLLSSIAGSLYKFAFDIRILQSAGFGEIQEPFGEKQVGSSAMPFKRNPILSERICSIARHLVNLSRTAWDNAAHSLLERTLDDSAARRIILPESFLATDEILNQSIKIVSGMNINKDQIKNNLEKYGPFASSEAVMMQAVKNGADRQMVHELIRNYAMDSYASNTPLSDLLEKDEVIKKYLNQQEIKEALDYSKHIGLASKKSAQMIDKIKKAVV